MIHTVVHYRSPDAGGAEPAWSGSAPHFRAGDPITLPGEPTTLVVTAAVELLPENQLRQLVIVAATRD